MARFSGKQNKGAQKAHKEIEFLYSIRRAAGILIAFNRAAKEWGRTNGFKVADKGALSTEVKEAYSKATGVEIPA